MKVTVRSISLASAIALCMFSTASSANAAMITFGNATNISGDTDVSTNGDLVFAFNVGDNGSSDTVNGVTFTGLAAGNSDLAFPSLTSANGGAFANDAVGSAFSSLSLDYQDILESGNFRGGNGSQTITLGNLDVGQGYEVQFWVNDARNRADQETIPRALTIDGTSIVLDFNTAGASTNAGLGQFVIGTFTADAATQDFSFTSGARQLNALQLRAVAVPEPSSIVLVGLGGLGLLVRRRRVSIKS